MRNKGVRQFVMRVDDELYEFLKKAPLEEVMTEEPLFLPEEPRGKKKRRVYVSLKKEDFKELELLAKRYAVSRSKLLRAKLRALRLKQNLGKKSPSSTGGDELPLDEMQNKEYTLYCLAIAKLSVGLERPELMPVEERIAPMKQEAPPSIRWSSSRLKNDYSQGATFSQRTFSAPF